MTPEQKAERKKAANRTYYKATASPKARSKSSETAATAKKERQPRKIMASEAEASDTIGFFSWRPNPMTAKEAWEAISDRHFYLECIEHGLDPLWAYRYLRWRLGNRAHREFMLMKHLPGPGLVREVVFDYIEKEWMEEEDGGLTRD